MSEGHFLIFSHGGRASGLDILSLLHGLHFCVHEFRSGLDFGPYVMPSFSLLTTRRFLMVLPQWCVSSTVTSVVCDA